MKKIGVKASALLLSLVLLAGNAALNGNETAKPDGRAKGFGIVTAAAAVLGDMDRDGIVTPADARYALRAAVGLDDSADGLDYAAGDVDGEKGISPADARLILRVAVGLETLKGEKDPAEEKAKELVGVWLEDPYQQNKMTIRIDDGGNYSADVYFYRTTEMNNCSGTVDPDGGLIFVGEDERELPMTFLVRKTGEDKVTLTVVDPIYPFSAGMEYAFARLDQNPSLQSIWDKLTGGYWMESKKGGAPLVMFTCEDGKCWFAPGYWQSEFWYRAYVDESTIRGDLNGVFTCTAVSPGHYDYFVGESWIPTEYYTVSFDFTNRAIGSIMFKQGDDDWILLFHMKV